MKILKQTVFAVGMALSAGATAATPAPEMLAGTCAACHGTGGSSVAVIPSLAGAPAEYFVDSMTAFKDGSRKATVMDRIAKGYSDEQIEAMGAYFAAQKLTPMKQGYDPVLAGNGKLLHEEYCNVCHEDGGKKPDEGGVLAGQSMIYLSFAMDDFMQGEREMVKKMKRRLGEMLEAHGQASVEALIHFYGSQQ